MTMTMVVHLLLLMPVIILSLPDTSASSSLQIQSQMHCLPDNNSLICQLQELKLKLAHSESILQESIQNSNAKSIYLRECEKLVGEMAHKIGHLQSTLRSIKVHMLWDASRKNNFDLHVLKYEAENAEDRLKEVTSKVETMANIVTEQWIQIQQLEQALQVTQVRVLKVQRQVIWTRCTFLKFINHIYEVHVKKMMAILEPARHSAIRSYILSVTHHLKQIWMAVRKYHHEMLLLELQGYVKHEMERNEITAALANREVVFFVASLIIIFPIMGAWMILTSSQV
ncbi:hypothetical protein RJ641_002234 [Dillenia turbinata]|uniref:Uncharacterized protein n=1 Tax=Dillenia turbinata TaxID=194707 RepID=A0AAN8ZFF9_9MAGN